MSLGITFSKPGGYVVGEDVLFTVTGADNLDGGLTVTGTAKDFLGNDLGDATASVTIKGKTVVTAVDSDNNEWTCTPTNNPHEYKAVPAA